jgi:hypothetical protein
MILLMLLSVASVEKAAAAPPDICNEAIFFNDNHEGVTTWTSPTEYPSAAAFRVPWTLGMGREYTSGTRWFANNYGVTTEARLESPSISIPAEASDDLFMRFFHAFSTEPNVDGGVVEISLNGGGFADVGVGSFTQNGYNRMLSGGTVLDIREAFSADSTGFPNYIESIVDLSAVANAGDSLMLRFRFATSDGQSGIGWYVDDVQLGYCASSNASPVAQDLAISTFEDTSVNDAVTATDGDGDPLIYSLDTAPANGIASVNADGSFIYTPNADYNGNDSFTVLVDDGNGGTDIALVDITVTGVNDAPTFILSGDPPVVGEDSGSQTVAGFATGMSAGPADEAGQNLTFNVTVTGGSLPFATLPAIDVLTGDLTYAASPNANGTAMVQVLLTDDAGTANGGVDTSAPQTFVISVNSINDPPVADDLTTSTPEDTQLNGAITAADADGDALTFTLGTPPINGAATVNPDGSFTYTPAGNFSGSDSFTVLVEDGNGGSDAAAVTIDVLNVNDNPVVTAGGDQTTDPNIPISVNATYTDADAGDTHTATIDWGDGSPADSVPAVGGSVSGSHTYTTSGNFTVTITVNDNNGGSGNDSLIVNVNVPTMTPTPTATSTSTPDPSPTPTPTPTATNTPSDSPTVPVPSATPASTTDAEPPPPAPLAADVNSDPESIVRIGVPDGMSTDIYVRVIIANGEYVLWQGSELTHGGFIGIQGVLDLGIWQAVDIFSPTGLTYFESGIVVCLDGKGTLVYLNANNAPRLAEIVGSYTVPEFPGFTCVTLFEPGTLALVDPV